MKQFLSFLVSGFFIISSAFGQDIGAIRTQKALKVRGNLGASLNFYESNEAMTTRPPWSWNLYGNFTPEVYGIAMPVSFVVNQYGNSFSQPFAQFGISPAYKWAKLHLGYRHIKMSPLVFDGQSFRGAGMELNPGILRFAAFYGRLNRKMNEDTTSGRYAAPQFNRTGYGIKLGAGNKLHYFDLIYFYAKDDTTSATVINKEKMQSRENAVIGASFKTTLIQKIILQADLAASGLTDDLNSPREDSTNYDLAENIFSILLPFNSSTKVNFGGQVSLNANLKNYNTTLGYRRVEPGFKSLGTPYMLDDIELYNWMNNLNLLEGKLNINANISNQHNNLQKNLASRLNTFVSSLNVSAMPVRQLSLNFNYSGYLMNQQDGTEKLKDSIRLNQQIHQLSLMPSYTIFNTGKSHTFSTSVNYMVLNDKNPATSAFTNSNNLAAMLNYNLGLTGPGLNFSVGGLYNQYVQDTNRYSTYGINLGTSGQFLKKKNLGAQITAGYMINKSTFANTQSNMTFSGNMSYRYEKHSVSLNANYIYTPYNPINEVIEKTMSGAVASKSFMGGISYNYSF